MSHSAYGIVPKSPLPHQAVGVDMGSSACSLRAWLYYNSPQSRCDRSLSGFRDHLCLGLCSHLELSPGAFANLLALLGGPEKVSGMLYFSLTTLTTTGYDNIVAVDPFARGLANLQSVLEQFYLAITVARLVTLELDDRRRRSPP